MSTSDEKTGESHVDTTGAGTDSRTGGQAPATPRYHTWAQCDVANCRCATCGKDAGSHYGVRCAWTAGDGRTFVCAASAAWNTERDELVAALKESVEWMNERRELAEIVPEIARALNVLAKVGQ